MKLKKIASLMLAGIMAVSMLAGCKGGSTSNDENKDDNTEVTTGSVILDALKVAQNGNDAQIKFELSTDVADVINKKLEGAKIAEGEDSMETELETKLIEGGSSKNQSFNSGALNDATVGTRYSVILKRYESVTEEKAAFDFASFVNDTAETLKASDDTNDVTYTYSGDVAVVSFTDTNGKVFYYIGALIETVCEKA